MNSPGVRTSRITTPDSAVFFEKSSTFIFVTPVAPEAHPARSRTEVNIAITFFIFSFTQDLKIVFEVEPLLHQSCFCLLRCIL